MPFGSNKKMNKKKIIISVILVVGLILLGKFLYAKLEDYCPRCKNPNIINNITNINKDNASLEFIYSKNNGSLPPPEHKENIYTISTDEKGTIKGKYVLRDYNKTLEQKPLALSKEQLEKLIAAVAKVDPKTNDTANSGCTGGSYKSIKISQNKKVFLETASYNCANIATNESLEKWSAEIEKILGK